jgi:hypothetical protein
MLPGIFFAITRFWQIVTLIPIIGMLSWFVHGFTIQGQLTPTAYLVLFIVSVLACFWALATILAYSATKHNGHFVAFVDFLFFGALIAGVYEMRGITDVSCASLTAGDTHNIIVDLGIFGSFSGTETNPFALHLNKDCSMIKASFALGIMNVIFFFWTGVRYSLNHAYVGRSSLLTGLQLMALWIAHHHRNDVGYRKERTVRREYSSRSHHSSRSPRRSHHSHRRSSRTYV